MMTVTVKIKFFSYTNHASIKLECKLTQTFHQPSRQFFYFFKSKKTWWEAEQTAIIRSKFGGINKYRVYDQSNMFLNSKLP